MIYLFLISSLYLSKIGREYYDINGIWFYDCLSLDLWIHIIYYSEFIFGCFTFLAGYSLKNFGCIMIRELEDAFQRHFSIWFSLCCILLPHYLVGLLYFSLLSLILSLIICKHLGRDCWSMEMLYK